MAKSCNINDYEIEMSDLLYEWRGLPVPFNVVFDPPVTVVFFSDGSKQVVKCREGDQFNEELGLAIAISRRMLNGNGSQFVRLLKNATRRLPREKKTKKTNNANENDTVIGTD